MKAASYAYYSGLASIVGGVLVLLALVVWRLTTGHWVALSAVDAIGLYSPGTAANVIIAISESDLLYFVYADTPLYALLTVSGVPLYAAGYYYRRK